MQKYKKRPDGRYMCQIKIGINGETGKPIYKTLYGRTQPELDKKVSAYRVQQERGLIIDDKNITVKDWSLKWLKTYKDKNALKTINQYENAITSHILPALGAYKLKDIKQHHLQSLLNTTATATYGKGNKLYSKRSLEIIRMTLKQIFNKAVQNHLIAENVADDLTVANRFKIEKRALTTQEREILLKVCADHKLGLFVMTLYYTGIRPGEALALTVNDIDQDNGLLTINKAVGFEKSGKPYLKEPKNSYGYRKVPIPNELLSAIKEHMKKADVLLFPAPNGSLMNESTYKRNWKNFEDKLNVVAKGSDNLIAFEHITPYHLRHNYASILYELNVDIKTAQKWFGHGDTTTLLKIYTHLSVEKETENIKKLQNFSNFSQSKISQLT